MAAVRVLVVDDVEDHREIYVQYLRFMGLEVEVAADGPAALALAAKSPFDVVVTDVGLPGMDGWELCRRLRAGPDTAGIPVIVLSAYALHHEDTAREAGCAAYLRKPCLPDTLLGEIWRIVGR
jgi:CheY-like chemotaxis protein